MVRYVTILTQKGKGEMMAECENHRCCCKCASQHPLYKHPWNNGNGKGSIMDIMGYVCDSGPEQGTRLRHMIFQENQHSCSCEYFESKVK
jgi:hypothetical protein